MAIIKDKYGSEVSAAKIKNALCRYFYNHRHCIYFGKEMDIGNHIRADFIALFYDWKNCERRKRIIEIEVKISWADFMKDFKDKKSKHDNYCSQNPRVNYFAFCVPIDIYEKCKIFLDEHYPKYGLFIYADGDVCQGRGSMFSEKRLLTESESLIKQDDIAKQMAIHILYPR